jgi:hypothetical protein
MTTMKHILAAMAACLLTGSVAIAATELRALDAGVLVDFRGPAAPTGKAPGQEHCPRCECAKNKEPSDKLPNADPQHHCALCRCPVNRVPPDLPPGAAIELVAPRGGTVSGQAVLRGQQLSGVKATPPVLSGPGGATLPVTVRWLTRSAGGAFANIFTATPVEKELQPVLVTVTVPANAVPGVYVGKLAVTATRFTGSVPVKVEVMSWVLPSPKEWKFRTGLVQSPDTIALQYKVAPWSDAHLKLLEPSLRLLRDVGSESCYVYLMAEGVYYARETSVRWRAPGQPLDFTILDKYLGAYEKVCGTPKTLTVQVWEGNRTGHLNATNSVKVTRLKADGTTTNVPAPYYDQPEALAFWKPAFDGLRDRLAKRGWNDTEVFLGLPWDSHPSEETIEFFKKVAPGWRWRVFTHGFNINMPQPDGKLMLPNGSEIGWIEVTSPVGTGQLGGKHLHLTRMAENTKRAFVFTTICRHQAYPGSQAWIWRDAPASAIQRGGQGVSQLGLDYWDLQLGGNETPPGLRMNNLIQIWGPAGFNPRHLASKSLTVPGPNGAEPTLEYELLREGLQVAAAFAVARDTEAGKAFEALVKARADYHMDPWLSPAKVTDPTIIAHARWTAAVRELYKAAAETKH